MKLLENLEEEKSKLIILAIVVGVLSCIIIFYTNIDKSYVKNIEVNNVDYDYKDYSKKDKGKIELKKVVPYKGWIKGMLNLDDGILVKRVKEEYIKEPLNNMYEAIINDNEIKIIDYETHKTNRILYSYKGSDYVLEELYLSPSENLLVYGIRSNKDFNIEYYLYNLRTSKKTKIGENFVIITWLPDSTGIIIYQDEKLLFYDIDNDEVKEIGNIDNQTTLIDMQFSMDGTKIYIQLDKIINYSTHSQIVVYDQKSNNTKILKNLKMDKNVWINYFKVIDGENIIINEFNGSEECISVYNAKENTSKSLPELKNVYRIYLNANRDMLATIQLEGALISNINIYEIKVADSNFELYKLSEINGIKGDINSLDINHNKLTYTTFDYDKNQSMMYIYDILVD